MKAFLVILSFISFVTLHCVCSAKNLRVGDKAPDFELLDQDGELVKLSDLKGQKVALYFYPKDSTPGCTQQACSLRDAYAPLKEAGIMIFGLSKGSVKSKQKFIAKHHLNFPLLVATKKVLRDYGVNTGLFHLWLPRRTTFLIDENGIIVAIIDKVDTKHHADQILDAFSRLE